MSTRFGATSGTEPRIDAEEREDDRVGDDPSRGPPREVLGVALDDARDPVGSGSTPLSSAANAVGLRTGRCG